MRFSSVWKVSGTIGLGVLCGFALRRGFNPESKISRGTRLVTAYQVVAQLANQETKFLSDRIGIFLILNSLMFAGFMVFVTSGLFIDHLNKGVPLNSMWVKAFSIAIPSVGIVWAVLQLVMTLRTWKEQGKWRAKATVLENYLGLGIRIFSEQGIPRGAPLKEKVAHALTAPNAMLGAVLPLLFLFLWVLVLLWITPEIRSWV